LNDRNIVSSNNIIATSSNDLQKPLINNRYVSDTDIIKDAVHSIFDELDFSIFDKSIFLEVMEANFETEQAILNSKGKRNRDGTIKNNFMS